MGIDGTTVIVTGAAGAFYARPATLQEMVDHTVGRVLDLFDLDIEPDVVRRWGEAPARMAP